MINNVLNQPVNLDSICRKPPSEHKNLIYNKSIKKKEVSKSVDITNITLVEFKTKEELLNEKLKKIRYNFDKTKKKIAQADVKFQRTEVKEDNNLKKLFTLEDLKLKLVNTNPFYNKKIGKFDNIMKYFKSKDKLLNRTSPKLSINEDASCKNKNHEPYDLYNDSILLNTSINKSINKLSNHKHSSTDSLVNPFINKNKEIEKISSLFQKNKKVGKVSNSSYMNSNTTNLKNNTLSSFQTDNLNTDLQVHKTRSILKIRKNSKKSTIVKFVPFNKNNTQAFKHFNDKEPADKYLNFISPTNTYVKKRSLTMTVDSSILLKNSRRDTQNSMEYELKDRDRDNILKTNKRHYSISGNLEKIEPKENFKRKKIKHNTMLVEKINKKLLDSFNKKDFDSKVISKQKDVNNKENEIGKSLNLINQNIQKEKNIIKEFNRIDTKLATEKTSKTLIYIIIIIISHTKQQ